jgi:outer membrane biosynthesis protein TonB
MAKKTPIDGKTAKRLASLGIEAETMEGAKTEILQKLKDADYEGFDDEPLDALIDIYEATSEPEEVAPKTATKPKTTTKSKAQPEPEEEEEEEEEVVAPKPKATTKPKAKSQPEEEEEEVELAQEVASKKPLKSVPKATTEKKAKNSNAFDKGNAEHVSMVTKLLQKVFPKAEYAINAITSGVSVRLMGDNVKIVLIKYNNITFDGKNFIGDVNFKKITNVEELEGLMPDDFSEKTVEKVEARGYCKVCDVSGTELVEMFSDEALFDAITKKGKSIDTKMGKNREKLSESLASTTKPKPKPKAQPEPEEEEEEEVEEVVAPKPKPKTKPKPKPQPEPEEEEEEEVVAPKPKAKKK